MTETGKDEYTSDEVVVYGEQLYSERPSQESVELDTLSSGTGSMADADLIITKEDGANAWVKKTASKLWYYIKGKIGISNGGSANKFLNERGTFTAVNSGKVYDVEMSDDLDEMTLTEDGTDKTTLPLVATFVGTHQEWNALSAAEQAKYRRVDFTDDGGFGTAYQIPYGNSNVGDTLTDLNSALSNNTLITTGTPTWNVSAQGGYFSNISLPSSYDEAKFIIIQLNTWTADYNFFYYTAKKGADGHWKSGIYCSGQASLRYIGVFN